MSDLMRVPITKKVRLDKGDGAPRQNLVFGWANVPHPVAKALTGSVEDELSKMRAALDDQFPTSDDGGYQWIVATFPDYVIVERMADGADSFLRHSYARSGDDAFVFGPGVEVEMTYVAKALSASSAGVLTPRPKTDLQGDQIEQADLEKAAYDFVLTSREGDVNHDEVVHSHLVESFVVTDEKLELMGLDEASRAAVNKGWWLGFQVSDPVMDRVESGELAMFSIGGTATRTSLD